MADVELRTSKEVLLQTEAQLKQARERLAKTEIRSPIGGKVTAVMIKAGETAVPSAMSIAGSTLLTVADTSSFYAEVNVDETDVARAAVGLSAKIVPAAFPDKSMSGRVEQVAISPKQNPGQNKSYMVKIRLDPTDGVEFRPGMSCRAEIATSAANGEKTLAVPVQAVRYDDTTNNNDKPKASLYVVESGRARKRDVETGTADDNYIAILRGLKENEEVIVGPTKEVRFLHNDDRVEVKPAMPVVADAKAKS
jgi:HlyD family secretion protein